MEELQSNQQINLNIDFEQINKITDEIIYGKKLRLNYINLNKYNLLKNKHIKLLNSLELLKYNIINSINQLVKYYSDINFNLYLNSPCAMECKIKKQEFTYNYGIFLIIYKDNKYYEYGYDFVENLNEITDSKYNDSKILLDNYKYFLLEDILTNEDIVYYMNNILFELLTTICALKDDEYNLAEIMFVKLNIDNINNNNINNNINNNNNQKRILKELDYFNKIINWKKINSINLEELYDNLQLIDEKNEENINYKKFINIINDICETCEINFDKKEKTITFEIFEAFILNLKNNYNSDIIIFYKRTYQHAMNILMESLKMIINLINKINLKKYHICDYINNFILFHLNEYKDDKINDKKIFDKSS